MGGDGGFLGVDRAEGGGEAHGGAVAAVERLLGVGERRREGGTQGVADLVGRCPAGVAGRGRVAAVLVSGA